LASGNPSAHDEDMAAGPMRAARIGGRHDRPGPAHRADGTNTVKVQISSERCQGHGRCYDLVPDLFGEDDQGYSRLLGDGTVPPGKEREARLAESNCPERAIEVLEET
jgi:ferredoxin